MCSAPFTRRLIQLLNLRQLDVSLIPDAFRWPMLPYYHWCFLTAFGGLILKGCRFTSSCSLLPPFSLSFLRLWFFLCFLYFLSSASFFHLPLLISSLVRPSCPIKNINTRYVFSSIDLFSGFVSPVSVLIRMVCGSCFRLLWKQYL